MLTVLAYIGVASSLLLLLAGGYLVVTELTNSAGSSGTAGDSAGLHESDDPYPAHRAHAGNPPPGAASQSYPAAAARVALRMPSRQFGMYD